VRYTALPEGRPPSSEPFSGHLLRGGHILYGRIWRLRAGHMAFSALHGRHDLHSIDCPSDTGTRLKRTRSDGFAGYRDRDGR